MAKLSDLKWRDRLFMQTYRYRRYDWLPGVRLGKPLAASRMAVITTAALHLPEQPPFDESFKGGDFSYRIIPATADLTALRMSHRSEAFDPAGIERDRNVAFPLDRFREMVGEGELGSISPRHYSFMGSIPAPGRLMKQSAPEVLARLREDEVDAVFLVPV